MPSCDLEEDVGLLLCESPVSSFVDEGDVLAVEQAVDAVCSGLAVSFEVRYVGGMDGERIAAAQAKALAALLKWQADHCDADRC
ncbi:hypothetical protein [Nocardia sp. NBC_01009]|uniref:hypothetical protein n=1 Tax=Nocardia sp. NBC_01009 TaxID=2975996 RepID=UPI003867226D|nr:hypothetical protein OHA42_09165 [Nocardia sp. NBC_01009]